MEGLQHTYQRSTYFDFLKIENNNWKEKVRFFERRYDDILDLDYIDQLEVWHGYARATFELGNYNQYIALADELVPSVISHNVHFVNGNDIYSDLLFYKGCSLYQLGDVEQATYIFSEVIKINPNQELYKKTYLRVITAEASQFPNWLKIFAVTNLIAYVLLSIFELLVAKTLLQEALPFISEIKIITLVLCFVPAAIYFITKYSTAYFKFSRLLKQAARKLK